MKKPKRTCSVPSECDGIEWRGQTYALPLTDNTNAGPVLPELPGHPESDESWDWGESTVIRAYGRQCAEHVAGPLRERIAILERDRCEDKSQPLIDELAECFNLGGADADGNGTEWRAVHAVRSVRQLRQDYDETCDEAERLRERVAELEVELDRLRAESVIEWEPGRSYTAAELLRRAIRGIRVRKGRPLWPAVMNLCGVGSNVGHHLCRWAGRDPDNGADLDAVPVAKAVEP